MNDYIDDQSAEEAEFYYFLETEYPDEYDDEGYDDGYFYEPDCPTVFERLSSWIKGAIHQARYRLDRAYREGCDEIPF